MQTSLARVAIMPATRANLKAIAANRSEMQRTVCRVARRSRPARHRSLHSRLAKRCRSLILGAVKSNDVADERAIPARWVIAVGIGTAAILALAVSTQTYLSMLGHGHAFRRILTWQLGTWSYWGFVAPLVLRRGAAAGTGRLAGWRVFVRLALIGTALIAAHVAIASQLAVWSQPFAPVVTYRFVDALVRQLPAYLAIDPLAYLLLLAAGGALAAHHRAQRLALRESRLEAELTRAQLHALRLEIEPHFLFNTLNSIAALIRLKDNRRALDMLVNVS